MSDGYTHIALITGANQGIGFEIAKKLATEHKNYHIIMTGRRADALESAAAKLRALGLDNLETLVLDVTSDESIASAAKAVEANHGRLDVLINNAGISTPGQGNAYPRQMWLDIYNVNVAGVAFVTDAFIPLLEKSKVTKRIVNVSSSLGCLADKADKNNYVHKLDFRAYTVSKTALNMLTLHYSARYDTVDPSWKVNMVCPGMCATNLNPHVASGEDPAMGAIAACRVATLGPEGETGTFSDRHGPRAW